MSFTSPNLINGNDGGANVSFNGGRTWSTQANQPTAQFYRVITDNQFPYFVYGGQQDNSTVAIASRSANPGITEADWYEVGGCENAHIAFNPHDPTLIYAGCYQGLIDEFDRRTRRKRNVMAYPAQGLAEPSHEQKYRFNWNAPILVSPHDPKVIYHAGNVLLRSDNRGRTWTAISPDLTRNEKDKQGAGGSPVTNEGAGGEVYNTIFYVVESTHQAGVIWAGTDDGWLHLTRAGGKRWEPVTPPGLGEAQINSIEISPHDAATAYVAATAYKRNDFTPHIFKTSDYGKTWRRLVTGIRDGDFVRVVRADPARQGLLYAGTETGVYVSFDDGASWQSLQLNLPVVPITDLTIRNHDLVAATQGRAFWILDDLTPLHQMHQADASAHLFKPRHAYRVEYGSRTGARLRPAEGRNPPSGAIIYYQLAAAPAIDTRLEIVDSGGQVIRKFTSVERKAVDAPGAQAPPRLPTKTGLNRFVWDLRSETITRVPGVNLSAQALSHRVAPGTYQARLTAGGKTLTQTFAVLADPRVKVDEADYLAQQELAATIHRRVNELHQPVIRLRDARQQINRLLERTAAHPQATTIATAGKALTAKITAWEETIIQPRQKTSQDVINYRNQLNDQYLFLAEAVDEGDPPVTEGMRARFTDLEAQWTRQRAALTQLEGDLAAFGDLLKAQGVSALTIRLTAQ